MTLIDKSKKSRGVFTNLEEISLLLRVHYKWLLKFLRKLRELVIAKKSLSSKTISEIKQLWETVSHTNNQLETVYDPMRKISKRIKKYLTLPPPRSTETSIEVHSKLMRITRDFDVRDERGSTLKQELKIVALQLEDALAMRRQTISSWSDMYSRKSIDETTLRIVDEVERFCNGSHVRLRVPAEVEDTLNKIRSLPEREMTWVNARIQLWPIYEYVFLSLASTLQGKMCRKVIPTISGVALAECVARFADVPSIPSDLMGLLSVITRTEVERGSELLLPELFCNLAQFVQRSYAFKDTSRLSHWCGITEEDIEKSVTSYAEPKVCIFLYRNDRILFVIRKNLLIVRNYFKHTINLIKIIFIIIIDIIIRDIFIT